MAAPAIAAGDLDGLCLALVRYRRSAVSEAVQ